MQPTNPRVGFEVTTDGSCVVSHAGAALLRELADRLELTGALARQTSPSRRRHPDAHVLRDLAVMLADGGDCLSDLAALRDQPGLFGPVASTPTAWRVIQRVAHDPDGLARLRAARAHARARAWAAGGDPEVEVLIVDADATLVLSHSDHKQGAAGTYKHSFGFHPLLAYLDHGAAPGEPLAGLLRPGNAPAGGAEDLIELVDLALAQLPATSHDQPVLVRSDSAGASTRLAWHLRDRGVGFSVGMQIDQHVREAILAQPQAAWTPAIDADGQARHGAQVCELTGWIDLGNWPPGTRALCRRENAHPGAQLRFTDHDGHRFQVFLTDQDDPDLARLELRHRQRARVEDRIRAAKATGLQNLPFDRWRRNAVWLELVLAAQDLTCWAQTLLLDGELAVAEPKTLRYRLLHVAARVVRHARRLILRLQASWPWSAALARAFVRLRALRCAADPPGPAWPCPGARASPACSGVPVAAATLPRPPPTAPRQRSTQPTQPPADGEHVTADPPARLDRHHQRLMKSRG